MTTRQYKRSRLRQLILPVIATGFLGYFGFHAFNGYFGIWAKELLEQQSALLEEQLAQLQAERKLLEDRVSLLRPENLDRDMIDEMARRKLGVMKHDEVVILLDGRTNEVVAGDNGR
jgi:cell division protein FtsB